MFGRQLISMIAYVKRRESAMNQHLVWIDLEMTGLDVKKDVIVEIASVITDTQLNIIATGPNIIIHQPSEKLENLDPWVEKTHSKSGLLDKISSSKVSMNEAEEQTMAFLERYTSDKESPLCGNSIGTDRAFLQAQMPTIANFVHYRNLDVSSIKLLHTYWQPQASIFEKKNNHRALDDIIESINELKYYKEHFFLTS